MLRLVLLPVASPAPASLAPPLRVGRGKRLWEGPSGSKRKKKQGEQNRQRREEKESAGTFGPVASG